MKTIEKGPYYDRPCLVLDDADLQTMSPLRVLAIAERVEAWTWLHGPIDLYIVQFPDQTEPSLWPADSLVAEVERRQNSPLAWITGLTENLQPILANLHVKGIRYGLCGGEALELARGKQQTTIEIAVRPSRMKAVKRIVTAFDYEVEHESEESIHLSRTDNRRKITQQVVIRSADSPGVSWDRRKKTPWTRGHVWIIEEDA